LTLPSKAEIADLKEYTKEKIEAFAKDNAKFKEDFGIQNHIIRSFDEAISLKA